MLVLLLLLRLLYYAPDRDTVFCGIVRFSSATSPATTPVISTNAFNSHIVCRHLFTVDRQLRAPREQGVRPACPAVVRTRSDASSRTTLARWTTVAFLPVLVSMCTTLACMYSEDWVKQRWHLIYPLVTDAHTFVRDECAVVDDLGLGADSH
jgi:hypothetical protein